jgi:ubiquinol-cytochrome c reductase iron-sulfur subunit
VRRPERLVGALFAVAAAAGLGLLVVYWVGGQPQLEGALLGVALGGIGAGLIVWAKELLPPRVVTEPRRIGGSGAPEREAVEEAIEEGGGIVTRRRLLVRLLGAAFGALGLAALFPIRSLGPDPGRTLFETPWRRGLRLIGEDGELIRADTLEVESFLTAFPEGSPGSGDGQVVLVRVPADLLRLPPERAAMAADGLVAYSKVCTHAGCPVGLYLAASHELRCPCHQSTFDVLEGATPVYGPAARALPQLPIEIDPEGYVRATGGFTAPPGPAFWGLRG